MAKAIAKASGQSTALAAAALFESSAGAGLENVTARDLLIPRLGILQGLSPQVVKTKAEFIKGASVGQICDIGMSELFEAEVYYLPVYYVKQWLEWAPRSSGKGLQGIHPESIMERTRRDDKNRPILDNGNLIAETHQYFGMNISALARKSFIPMASTQIKKARKWNTDATAEKMRHSDGTEFTPALFSRIYKLSTVPESNSEGDWVGWKVERAESLAKLDKEGTFIGFNTEVIDKAYGLSAESLFSEAKLFREQLIKGEAKADLNSMADEVSAGVRGSGGDSAGEM